MIEVYMKALAKSIQCGSVMHMIVYTQSGTLLSRPIIHCNTLTLLSDQNRIRAPPLGHPSLDPHQRP